MNLNPLMEVRTAITAGELDRARDLLRPHLINQPTAEAYYLAYNVAINDYQRRKFLNQALELDPFFEDAEQALQALDRGEPLPNLAGKPKPSVQFDDPFSSDFSFGEKLKRDFSEPIGFGFNQQSTQDYELAGFWQRFGAYFLDGIIYLIVVFAVFAIFIFSQANLTAMNSGNFESLQRSNNVLNLFLLSFNIVYNVYFLTQRDGQTPGKMALGIKVIKRNGEPLSMLDAFLRNVVGYQLSGFLLFLGFLWMLRDPNKQTWHDKIVNTVVVKKQ